MYIPRVISSLMPKFINESVKLLAQLIEIDQANAIGKVRDCSKSIIVVYNFKVTESCAGSNEWIEIIGISKGKSHLHASRIQILPSSAFMDFDEDIYVETIALVQMDFCYNNFIVTDIEEHWGASDHAALLNNTGESKQNDQAMENISDDEANTVVFAL